MQASIFVAKQSNNNEVNTYNGIIYYIVRYMNSQRVGFVTLFVGNIFHNTFNKLHENFSIREVENRINSALGVGFVREMVIQFPNNIDERFLISALIGFKEFHVMTALFIRDRFPSQGF